MASGRPRTPVGSVSFRLGVLGVAQEAQFAAGLTELELKPKHVAVLSVLRLQGAESQLELAQVMRVAPSLVVLLVDQLEARGAVSRVRDPADRRKQQVHLTEEGARLLEAATEVTARLDEELVGSLNAADRAALTRVLDRLAAGGGLLAEGGRQA
ncbi:MarR family transcriptional regulator [Actinoplanes sp. NPDC049596]|uniref:MarR family winged helix-turn-helix transcriptional regulator n=1 Tax=unclassified Actinoplanes TaxID=2626549 RepID=UPI00344384BF